ncbi:MAG: hypothetical protein K2N25_06805 [Muribaculaceae bacterium]|nr:hypothetical protein [Muribaculaceae bacterium]
MYSNLKLTWAAVIGASFLLAGCSNDDVAPIENITIVEEGNIKPAQKAESNQPTAILGSGGSISGLLSKTFNNIVEPEKAKHVIVACSDLDTYEQQIVEAYKRGIVITVVDPVGSVLDRWCAAKGMIFAGDLMSMDDSSLVSFNRKAVSITVQKTKTYKDDDIIIGEDEVPMLIFTGWLDDILTPNLKGPDFRSREIKKRIAPQSVSHVFPISIHMASVSESGWGVPENVALNTTAELACDIYQIHSFADNASFSGDIYAVEAELTIHNGNVYNGRWQYSQGDRQYESSGFRLTDCGLAVSLYDRTTSGLEHSNSHILTGGPAPLSTEVSSTLQSGFEWSFDGWISCGNGLESASPMPLQEGHWIWNNLTDNASTGLGVATTTNGGDILWTLAVAEDGDKASGDLKFHCSWIWGVPQASDDSDGRYYMQVDLTPLYQWTRKVVSGQSVDTMEIPADVPSARFMLIPPSRAEGQRVNM